KFGDTNFIGIEKSATIVLKAIDKLQKDLGIENPPSNLRFLCIDIDKIENYFDKNSVDKIYLNFSDPWPKKRHESRRLTHLNFLKKYERILKNCAMIEFKTDNVQLFDFSIEEIGKSNFEIISKTYDLHNDEILNKDNIMTEYEEKFSSKGNKICKLIAKVSK
ncbi:MAG: tRNA (guanosine(46)-N7)-methyltransferase TrmB, partial [Lachnospiraceae bacterium]|nr:tRNA (guanosine(46)-N7)-methyltransferase TrmB [Lachnospiraceae bacterium]